MATTLTLKSRSPEWKVEWYEADFSFSEDKEDPKDLPALVKQLLEKQGHKVRRVVVSTEFERRARKGGNE